QRRHEWGGLPHEQREWVVIEVEVQDVEVACLSTDMLEHGQMQGVCIADAAVQPQRPRPYRLELGRRARISAREQRNVMALCHELFSQPRNDPFGASVELRWNCLGKRRDLRNAHFYCLFIWPIGPVCKSEYPLLSTKWREACSAETFWRGAALRSLHCGTTR